MEIALLIFAGICLLLAIWGYTVTRNNQKAKGCFPIGGPNGGAATSFFNKHPKEKAIFEKVDYRGGNWTEQQFLDLLFASGAKALVTAKYRTDTIVVTDEMVLVLGNTGSAATGTKGQLFTANGLDLLETLIKTEVRRDIIGSYTTTTPAEKKSVVKNAVAGAVVAGGVGAVVGAVAAADHNNHAKETVHNHFAYGDIRELIDSFHYYLGNANDYFEIDKIYLANGVDINTGIPYYAIKEAFNWGK